jgi:transketolase
MRNAFIDELVAASEIREDIALVVGDLGYSVVEPFATRFPERFFNAGVAEQNMMGLSAGLASEGFHVFVYSIANFPTFRCAEQIRNDVDYHQLPVTIVTVGGGLSYGNMGYSHHAVQDYALMRIMPNMLIAAPGDPMETRACVRYLLTNPQPSYLRLAKAGEPCFHPSVPQISPGKWLPVNPCDQAEQTVLATGGTLQLAASWIEKNQKSSQWALCSMPLWGMKCKNTQIQQVKDWHRVKTFEDHLLDAGFGSWLLEALSEQPSLMSRLSIKALNSKACGAVGTQSTLNKLGGLI